MIKIFDVSSIKHEFYNIKSYMNEIFVNLETGIINRIVIIDYCIYKSLKIIKINLAA